MRLIANQSGEGVNSIFFRPSIFLRVEAKVIWANITPALRISEMDEVDPDMKLAKVTNSRPLFHWVK